MNTCKDTVEHESFPDYKVNRNGSVYSEWSKRYLNPSKNPAGYYNVRLRRKDGHALTLGIHRLLCMCFKPYEGDYSKLQVNHIDGIKGNNDLDNLEWVTPRENVIHAGKYSLTEKCKPVVYIRLDTWEKIEFDSIVSCARHFGLSKDYVNWRVNGMSGIRSKENFIMIYKSNFDDFLSNHKEGNNIVYLDTKIRQVSVKFLLTGEIKIFSSMTELSKEMNIPISVLSGWLRIPNQPVFKGYVQMKFFTDQTPWREVGDLVLELSKTSGYKPVVVLFENGEHKIFESGSDCMREFSIKATTLSNRLKSKGNVVFSDGNRYLFYSDFVQMVPLVSNDQRNFL